jgi:hypothetical protein
VAKSKKEGKKKKEGNGMDGKIMKEEGKRVGQ